MSPKGRGHGHFDVENWWSQYPQVAKQIMQLTTVGHTMVCGLKRCTFTSSTTMPFSTSYFSQSTSNHGGHGPQHSSIPAFQHSTINDTQTRIYVYRNPAEARQHALRPPPQQLQEQGAIAPVLHNNEIVIMLE